MAIWVGLQPSSTPFMSNSSPKLVRWLHLHHQGGMLMSKLLNLYLHHDNVDYLKLLGYMPEIIKKPNLPWQTNISKMRPADSVLKCWGLPVHPAALLSPDLLAVVPVHAVPGSVLANQRLDNTHYLSEGRIFLRSLSLSYKPVQCLPTWIVHFVIYVHLVPSKYSQENKIS